MKRLILFLLIVGIVISMAVNTPAQQRVLDPNWQAYGCQLDTSATTKWDTVALGGIYEKFMISCATVSNPFWVSFGAAHSDSIMVQAGESFHMYFITDTVCVKSITIESVIAVNKFRRAE